MIYYTIVQKRRLFRPSELIGCIMGLSITCLTFITKLSITTNVDVNLYFFYKMLLKMNERSMVWLADEVVVLQR